ncbi:MAG: SMP-30/gluconolactonase/LRE family protein [Verrucomicrobia bacterium]|nr:SMP-30/gluconolactonase/LRE family protein [Verrucomicrobiota bacterium]
MTRTSGIRDEIEIYDERFFYLTLGNAWVEKLHTGSLWAEGPVYFADGDYLVWSDIPNNRMLRWAGGHVSVFRDFANNSNGNTRDRQGRLVTCEHGTRRVTRTEPDGSITVLVDQFEGKKLNSPNDVVVKSDGTIWFTDPPYGIFSDYEGHVAESEYGGCYVFRYNPVTGNLEPVAKDFNKPNGIAFSPDESKLYVVDTGVSHSMAGEHHIRSFSVDQLGRLSGGDLFAEVSPGLPDGLRVDLQGNIWTSAGDGVHCYAPDGVRLGKILVPEPVANLTFGGPKRNRIFITATTSLYAVYVAANGAQRP